MSGIRELKAHINSIRDTRKITNAMYLIASTKLRKARADLDNTRPYFAALRGEITEILSTADEVSSLYFYDPNREEPMHGDYGCLVITADKGLAGSYNQNAIREAQRLLEQHPNTKLFVVGEYGRRFFAGHGIPIEHSFLYTAQNPTMLRAREISTLLLDLFNQEKLREIQIVYTDMENNLTFAARTTRLLPFQRTYFQTPGQLPPRPNRRPFDFVPSKLAVLNGVMESYISGFIYSALIDSFCCEQHARMSAMDSANRNAEKLLDDLSLQFNRTRQAAITQEITEVSAGALAQRRSHGQGG